VALPKCQTRHIPRAHAYFNSCVPTDAQGINSSSGLLQHVLAFPCSIGNLGCASLTFQHDFPRPIVYSKVGCVLCHIQKKAQRVAREQTNQTTTDGPSNLPSLHREAGQRTLHITLKACLEGTALPNNVLQTCRGGFGKPFVFICHRLPTIPL
jgi:hypothetical protein